MPDTPRIHNIGTTQRRQRWMMGVTALVLATVLAAMMPVLGVGLPIRLLLAPLVFGGFVGVLQSREHTCVALAARGQCSLGAGIAPIEDESQRRAVQRKALGVVLKALGATALVMAAVVLLP